jgi:hypothetical protein
MRFLTLVLPLSLAVLADGQRPSRPAEVEVLESSAHREDGKIMVDGRLRATADKPLRGLIVYFDLMSPENGVVGSQKAVLDEDLVQPGEVRTVHALTSDHVRAVKFKIRAFDTGEKELRVANIGPFPIE